MKVSAANNKIRGRRLMLLVPGIAVVLCTVLVYSNSLNGAFVFDDNDRILRNPVVWQPELTWARAKGLFLFARPLSDLTLRLNFQFGGLDPRSYHLFNIATHVLAALVLMGFATTCFRLAGAGESNARASGFALSLLWAVHPLQTEAVTYIYQRAESLGGLFFLLTMYCAGYGLSGMGNRTARRGWLIASVAACATGHLCKQTLFTAPLAVLAFDFCFVGGRLREVLRRSRLYYISLALTCLIGVGLILATKADESVGYSIKNVSMFGYALTQPGIILHYLKLSTWPNALLLNYNWPVARTMPAIFPPLLAVLALLAIVVYSLTRSESHWRALGFVGAWFFITLAMSSSFFPIKDLAVEHRMYLALASVATLVVVVMEMLVSNLRMRLALILVLAFALGVRTYLRNEDYKSSYTIWTGVLEKIPDDPRALNELGNAYRDDGRLTEALALYQRAIQADPENPGPHLNAGFIQLRLGNAKAAEVHYVEAIRIRPDYPDAHLNLGNVLVAQGRQEEALRQYDIALKQKPDFFEALAARANTLCTLNRFDESLEYYRKALQCRPDRFEIYSDIGTAFFRMGRYEEALGFYYESLRRQPDAAAVHLSTAKTLQMLGRQEEAHAHEMRAKELMLRPSRSGSSPLVMPDFGPR